MKTSKSIKENKSTFQLSHLASLDRTGMISKSTSWRRLQEKAKTTLNMIWTNTRFSSYSLYSLRFKNQSPAQPSNHRDPIPTTPSYIAHPHPIDLNSQIDSLSLLQSQIKTSNQTDKHRHDTVSLLSFSLSNPSSLSYQSIKRPIGLWIGPPFTLWASMYSSRLDWVSPNYMFFFWAFLKKGKI